MSFNKSNKPYLIGMAGGSASGKTFFLRSVRQHFNEGEVCIISQDNYYRPVRYQVKDDKGVINFDLPEGVDDTMFLNDIEALSQNETVERQEYMFNRPGVTGKMMTLVPAPVIIVEGLFIFHFPGIRNILDLKVFMDSRDDIKLTRRLERDSVERGISHEMILYQWHNHVIPTYNRYLLPYRDEADVILTNNYSFEKGFTLLRDHIRAVVNKNPE
jgi:uridine kinase